jgi:predicted phosphodiesterase
MRRCSIALALVAAGCFTKDIPDRPPDHHEGGAITLDAPCGYTVTTHDGASRPETPSPPTLGMDPTPKFVHLNVASDPTRGMAVLWRTNDNTSTATEVQFGVGGALDQTAKGFTFVYDVPNADALRMHETHLCGLKADTEYSYRVGGSDGNKEVWSPTYTFRTAPASATPDSELVLLVIGDTREGYSTWAQALQVATEKATPDFIVFTGDGITLGILQDEWDTWFAAADPLFASTPTLVVHGNHDDNSANWFSQFAMPGDEQNYAVDIGPAHITVANDTPMDSADLTGINAQLLDMHLATSAPWNVLVHHKPMWTAAAGPHPNDAITVRNAWQPIVDAHRVDVVFNGHDHDYERTKPMRNGQPVASTRDGTVYVVAGSAGAELYEKGSDFWTAFSEKTFNFAIARVRVGSLHVTAYRVDGTQLDDFMLTK